MAVAGQTADSGGFWRVATRGTSGRNPALLGGSCKEKGLETIQALGIGGGVESCAKPM